MIYPELRNDATTLTFPDPSEDAEVAIFAFITKPPLPFGITMALEEYQQRIMRLLVFLLDEFDTELGAGDITSLEVRLRKAGRQTRGLVMTRLIDELSEKGCKFDFHKSVECDAFVAVIHWFVQYKSAMSVREGFAKKPNCNLPQLPEPKGHIMLDKATDIDFVQGDDRKNKNEPVFPKEYLEGALGKIRTLQDGPPQSLSIDDSSLPRSLQLSSRSTNLSIPPLKKIADHMLLTTKEKQPQRYADFLDQSKDLRGSLLTALTPAAKAVLSKGSISVDDLISIGGSPEKDEDPGIYLHVLRLRDEQTMTNNPLNEGKRQVHDSGKETSENPSQPQGLFYLYVGQGNVLCERIIREHENPHFRIKHPSLHYQVWDSLEKMGGCDSIFVKLAGFKNSSPDGPSISDQLLWNLEEMLMCLALQTLRACDLNIWLPGGIENTWAGSHLNLALPLWQGYAGTTEDRIMMKMNKAKFQSALRSQDPLIQNWAFNMRDAYQSLRDHPDPKMREIWFSGFRNFEKAREASKNNAYATGQRLVQRNFSAFLASGQDLQVRQSGWGYYYVKFSGFSIQLKSIPQFSLRDRVAGGGKMGKVEGKTVFIQPQLLETPSPLRYAQLALETDPASRLVMVAGRKDGTDIPQFLFHDGKTTAMSMNWMVDIFEGLTLRESECLPRRNLRKKQMNRKRKRRT